MNYEFINQDALNKKVAQGYSFHDIASFVNDEYNQWYDIALKNRNDKPTLDDKRNAFIDALYDYFIAVNPEIQIKEGSRNTVVKYLKNNVEAQLGEFQEDNILQWFLNSY